MRGNENGFNRWEWLCKDPQSSALRPFQANINYRLIVKDNHRPCISKPMDVSALPPQVDAKMPGWCSGEADVSVPQLSWKECKDVYLP
jgi:hypothetical protein